MTSALGGGGVILYDVDSGSWQHRACRITNRNLLWDEWSRFIGPDIPNRRIMGAFAASALAA